MVKSLIVEDGFTSRLLLQEILKHYGETHVAVNGREAIEAASLAIKSGEPYDLICLDIMMPEVDGQAALRQIRAMEEIAAIDGAKIIMTTALSDTGNVVMAIDALCDAYLVKPIDKAKFLEKLRSLKLIP